MIFKYNQKTYHVLLIKYGNITCSVLLNTKTHWTKKRWRAWSELISTVHVHIEHIGRTLRTWFLHARLASDRVDAFVYEEEEKRHCVCMFESLSCTFSRYVRYVNEWMNLWGGQPLNESDFRKELPTTHTCTQIWLYFVCMRENRSNRIGKTSRKREKKREQMHFAACYISLSVSKEMVGDFLPPHSRRRWR